MSLLVKGISKEEVRDALLSDGVRFPGGNIDMKVSQAGVRAEIIAEGSVTADGTGQELISVEGLGHFYGVIDLSQLGTGDAVRIGIYGKAVSGGSWKRYYEETFSGPQTDPLGYIIPKVFAHGFRVTLKQYIGTMRSFDYTFYREG